MKASTYKKRFRKVYHKLLIICIKPDGKTGFEWKKGLTEKQKSNYVFATELDWLSHFDGDKPVSKVKMKRFEKLEAELGKGNCDWKNWK